MKKLLVALALPFIVAACGSSSGGGKAASDVRVVQVTMKDNTFSPAQVAVAKGETVRFEFTNKGTVTHEALLGDEMAQDDHEKAMGDDMNMQHGNADNVTVKPNKTASITHTFNEPDSVLIGCHESGHYMSGMKMAVTVSAPR